jgi:hypothetical protein
MFRRRKGGSVNFHLMNWASMKIPLSDANSYDFWMGMDNLHAKCGTPGACEFVVIYTEKYTGIERTEVFNEFYIENEAANYRLHLDGFDEYRPSIAGHSNAMFSTPDRDNDTSAAHCGNMYGPFWHTACHNTNPFGNYAVDGTYGVCLVT